MSKLIYYSERIPELPKGERLYLLAEVRASGPTEPGPWIEMVNRRSLEDRIAKFYGGNLITDLSVWQFVPGDHPTLKELTRSQVRRIYRADTQRLYRDDYRGYKSNLLNHKRKHHNP